MNRFAELSYDAKAKGVFLAGLASFVMLAILLLWNGVSSIIDLRSQSVSDLLLIERSKQLEAGLENTKGLEGLFQGGNTAIIQSLLQNQLKDVGDPYRIAIDSMEPLNVARQGSLTRVEFRMSGALPEKNLGPFLVALALAKPAVIVTDMDLRPALARNARIQVDDQSEQRLSIQLTLNAFAKASADAR